MTRVGDQVNEAIEEEGQRLYIFEHLVSMQRRYLRSQT